MRNSIKISLALFLLPCILAVCANAQNISSQDRPEIEVSSNADLSTGEIVLAELQQKVSASKLDTQSKCRKVFSKSPEIIIIGSFRYDYGCHFKGVMVASRYFERNDATLSKTVLDALGWEKAPQREREMLADFWVTKGLLAFSRVVYTKDKDLNDSEFQLPRTVTAGNGETIVTLWIQLPPGMRRTKKNFKRLEFRFAVDGNMSGNSTL